MGGLPRRTSCLVAESPGFTGLGLPSLPGFPVSPLPGQCINSQPWLRALTHRVAPLMRGRPGRRRRRARATGLLPVGPPWAGAEAALPRGWGVAQCATTALAAAVPRLCGPIPGVVSLPFPPSRPTCPAQRVAGRPVRLSLSLARWYANPRGLCVLRARSGCPSGSPRVPFACVCARAPAASAPPPWVVWRAHLARSRHWALVGPFHVVRAPPRVLPWSLAPSGVLGGGRSGPGSSLPGLACTPCGSCVPRGWWGAVPGGGWPATFVRGVWCQALSLPLSPVLWGGQPGSRDPCVPGAVGAGVGTQHRPHSVRPCRPALLSVGLVERRPRGGSLPPLRGTSEVRRSPSPDCPSTAGAVGVRYPRAVGGGVWVWGPNTVPLARTPCGGCVPRGWWEAVPGGGGLPPL